MENENNFFQNFFNVDLPIFGETNVHKIFKEAKKSGMTEPASLASIREYQSKVEAISKMKERRQLRYTILPSLPIDTYILHHSLISHSRVHNSITRYIGLSVNHCMS